jgi:2-keto-3-deoxy-L-rhamnonate aldolase RhmA
VNRNELEMIEILKKLKDKYGVIEIKAEYENEGSRADELTRLKDVASAADLPIIIKIGGVEAITDIYNAIILGAKGIVAPMAETKFAVSKFIDGIKNFVAIDNQEAIDFAINIETITAYNNIDDILSCHDISVLSGITIGRVDFIASMGKDRGFANSQEMLQYCMNIFTKCRENNLKCALGGAISTESGSFIEKLVERDLVDKFETRKIVYDKSALNNIQDGILQGVEFELLWLKSKERYYHKIKLEDQHRIKMLQSRLTA